MSETLYRFWQDETLLYVGISSQHVQRMRAHSKSAAWWDRVTHATFEHFASRQEVADAERDAIRLEKPEHNIVGTEKRAYRRAGWEEPKLPPVPIVLGASDPLERRYRIVEAARFTGAATSRLTRAIGDGELHAWRVSERGAWRFHGQCLNDWVNGIECVHLRAREAKVAA